MVVYEKSHDYAERVTSIMYNLMRDGVPIKTATEQIIESLTKTAGKLFPTNPRLVSSQYFSLEAARYCEKHFLGKVNEANINRKFFLKGIDDFGEPLLDVEYEVHVEDMSSFYYDFFLRRCSPVDHYVEKQPLEEGGGHLKKRPLAEEDKEGNQQPVKKRVVEKEKGTSKPTTGGKTPRKTSAGNKAIGKTTTGKTTEVVKKVAKKNTAGKQ